MHLHRHKTNVVRRCNSAAIDDLSDCKAPYAFLDSIQLVSQYMVLHRIHFHRLFYVLLNVLSVRTCRMVVLEKTESSESIFVWHCRRSYAFVLRVFQRYESTFEDH